MSDGNEKTPHQREIAGWVCASCGLSHPAHHAGVHVERKNGVVSYCSGCRVDSLVADVADSTVKSLLNQLKNEDDRRGLAEQELKEARAKVTSLNAENAVCRKEIHSLIVKHDQSEGALRKKLDKVEADKTAMTNKMNQAIKAFNDTLGMLKLKGEQ